MFSDARQHLAQIGFGVETVEFGRADQAVAIIVSTTGNALLIPSSPFSPLRMQLNGLQVLWAITILLALLWMHLRKRPKGRHAPSGLRARLDFGFAGLALAITIAVMSGCGGGGSTTPKGTPPGNYTLTVTMTAITSSGKQLTHNQQLTLTVQ